MSYYGAGDYYGAGGLGSFLGGVARTVGGAVVGGLTGGLPGAIAGGLSGAGIFGGGGSRLPAPSTVFAPGSNQPGIDLPGGIALNPLALLPGGKPAITMESGIAPRGYHLNRSGYFTKSGYVAPRSKYVRNRSRNFANGRALRRAIGRVKGFERLVKSSRKSLRSIAKV